MSQKYKLSLFLFFISPLTLFKLHCTVIFYVVYNNTKLFCSALTRIFNGDSVWLGSLHHCEDANIAPHKGISRVRATRHSSRVLPRGRPMSREGRGLRTEHGKEETRPERPEACVKRGVQKGPENMWRPDGYTLYEDLMECWVP